MSYDLDDTIRQLFAAYNRVLDDATLQMYRAGLKRFSLPEIARAVMDYAQNGSDKAPTLPALVRKIRELQFHSRESNHGNRKQLDDLINGWYRRATDAGWSLPQRDQLVDVCEAAMTRDCEWRMTVEQLREQVKHLAAEVRAFRAACQIADANNEPRPNEQERSWAWAITQDQDSEWDPMRESLVAYMHRTKGMTLARAVPAREQQAQEWLP